MDLGDIVDKAKGALENVSDEQIEGAADMVKGKVDDQYDGIVDKAADLLEGFNN